MNKKIGRIIRRFHETITVRKGGTPVIDPSTGRLTQPVDEADVFEMKAAIYPAKDRDLLFLPEGTQITSAIVVWAEKELTQANTTLNKVGDEILYNDVYHEIVRTQDWGNIGSFFKHIAIRRAP